MTPQYIEDLRQLPRIAVPAGPERQQSITGD